MSKLVFIVFIYFMPGFQVNSEYDVIEDISSCLKEAKTKELSSHFSSTISLTLLNDDGVYSKVQAEIILREFLNRNAPEGIKTISKLDANPNFKYVVLQMTTSRGDFRVSYKLATEIDSFKMTELRIERSN